MSYSANHKNKKYIEKEYLEDNFQTIITYKRESSKKDKSRLNIEKLNNKNVPNNYSNSITKTNISFIKDKKNDDSDSSYPIKSIIENIPEMRFIPKRKLSYKPYSIINNKVISFQNQKNKKIIEFPLFDDNLIFKDINRSYLQDEHSDDGADSSEEKINEGKFLLSQEIEDSIKKLSKIIKKDNGEKILSRKIRFNNEEK